VAVAVRGRRGDVLIAEVPFSSLLKTVDVAAGRRSWSMWVVERSGEIIAGTSRGREAGGLGVQDWPSIYAQLQWGGAAPILNHGGQDYHAAISLAPELGWYFVGEAPMAWANPEIRRLVLYMLASLAGCLLMGLLIASFWASLLVRPLRRIVARAAQATSGAADARPWPRGAVVEFNRLSSDLEAMEVSLQEREQTFQALFEASPVPIAVVSADDRLVMRDVNEAWCRALGRARDSVVGRSVSELGLMRSRQEQLDLLAEMADGRTSTEIWLVRGDGEEMLMQAFGGRNVTPKTEQVAIWVVVDIGPMRRIERELQELNAELEVRVEHRTQALAASNEELSLAVAQLRATQHQLVQAEKMASLGGLVAGVAHELNTPLGNGVMSVSAMADATRHFTSAMQGGLRRADFQQFIESVEQGVGIAGRNLRRAADLVQSFKQVAVDQTGAQRRSFELREVVNEMVASMRPSFSRTPYRIEVDVAEAGLRLDSYPGALGQTIGNLIQNAVLHGFDGRDHGTVRIDGERAPDGWIVLRVADDGEGIAAEHLGRLFDPFMTVKMGGGGTGLGLHISYNAVTGLLGGTLTVRSTVGEGTVFELRLPTRAPVHVDAPQQVGSGAVVPPAA
jgi:PAS domain S-box-containing protein